MIAQTSGTALLFVVLTLIFGEALADRGAKLFQTLDKQNGREFFALAFTFGFAWLAQSIELAAIVGAFAAGLVMRDHIAPTQSAFNNSGAIPTFSTTIAPLERFLSPLFFLFVGMQVDVTYFFDVSTLVLAGVFSICAVIGKLLAGVVAGRALDRATVGIGMVPRGEVGLVFLGVGRGLGVVSDSIFAALVIVIFATTIITPPALKWSLRRSEKTGLRIGHSSSESDLSILGKRVRSLLGAFVRPGRRWRRHERINMLALSTVLNLQKNQNFREEPSPVLHLTSRNDHSLASFGVRILLTGESFPAKRVRRSRIPQSPF